MTTYLENLRAFCSVKSEKHKTVEEIPIAYGARGIDDSLYCCLFCFRDCQSLAVASQSIGTLVRLLSFRMVLVEQGRHYEN